MNKHLKQNLISLMLLVCSASAFAETETIISRITLIKDDYIIIDRDNEKNKRPAIHKPSTKFNFLDPSRLPASGSLPDEESSFDGPTKFDLVTENNEHLSPYPLTEFWINKEKSDYNTFKSIGYTHEAEITIEDGTVRKIRTLDDYIL